MSSIIYHFEDKPNDVSNFSKRHLIKHVSFGANKKHKLYFVSYKDPNDSTRVRSYAEMNALVKAASANHPEFEKLVYIVDLNPTGGDAVIDFIPGLLMIEALATQESQALTAFLSEKNILTVIRSYHLDDLKAVIAHVPTWRNARGIHYILNAHDAADPARAASLASSGDSRVIKAHKVTDDEWLAKTIGIWVR